VHGIRDKESHVIVDVRAYRVKPGKMPQELDLYAKRGLAPQIRHLGPPLAEAVVQQRCQFSQPEGRRRGRLPIRWRAQSRPVCGPKAKDYGLSVAGLEC
jgi:hypothetical protein